MAPTATSDVDLIRDRSLVESAQAGDIAAFGELYTRYFHRLVRFAVKRVGDRHEAEEIAQEAFVRAWRALPGFGGERRFYPWISVIASRLCIDNLRRRGRVEIGEVADAEFIDAAFDRVDRAGDLDTLMLALDRLNDRHREVLELREQRGWTYQHIADHYQVSIGTVEALLWRARRSLRREFLALCSSVAALPVIRRFTLGSKTPGANVAALGSVGTVVALTVVSGTFAGLPAASSAAAAAAAAPTAAVAFRQAPAAGTAGTPPPPGASLPAPAGAGAGRPPGRDSASAPPPVAGPAHSTVAHYAADQRLITGTDAHAAGEQAPIQVTVGSGGPTVALTPPVSTPPIAITLGGHK